MPSASPRLTDGTGSATGFGDGRALLRERCCEGDCPAPPGLVTTHPVELDVEVLLAPMSKQSDQLEASSHRAIHDEGVAQAGGVRGQDRGTEGGGTKIFGTVQHFCKQTSRTGKAWAKFATGTASMADQEGKRRQKTS